MFNLAAYLDERRQLINDEFSRRMPARSTRPVALHEAMHYSVFSGGKRLRPILCMAAAEATGGRHEDALLAGLSVEAVHTYSLVHDDLPCMDNDDLRRGEPTLHKAYDEATALLAGDALLTLAFEWIASVTVPPPYLPSRLSVELAKASGSLGIIAGQVEDIAATGGRGEAELVRYIHTCKTGALITAAVRMGAISAGANERQLAAITSYGNDIGLAFQIADDILNAASTQQDIGKPVGSDKARGKLTYVSVFGLDEARTQSSQLVNRAIESVRSLGGKGQPLIELARYVSERQS